MHYHSEFLGISKVKNSLYVTHNTTIIIYSPYSHINLVIISKDNINMKRLITCST